MEQPPAPATHLPPALTPTLAPTIGTATETVIGMVVGTTTEPFALWSASARLEFDDKQ